MSNTAHDFCDSGVRDMPMCVQKKQVAGEVSLTPGPVISGWFPRRICVARVYTGRCRRSPAVAIDLSARRKARRSFFFIHPRLATLHIRGSCFVPPTTGAVAVATRTRLWPIDRRPVPLLYFVVIWKACIKQRGGGSLPSPMFVF